MRRGQSLEEGAKYWDRQMCRRKLQIVSVIYTAVSGRVVLVTYVAVEEGLARQKAAVDLKVEGQ